MTFNAIFFALGVIAFPAISASIKIFYVFSTGKSWKTQHDIEIEKVKIRNSSFVSVLNFQIEELQSKYFSQAQEITHINNLLSDKEKELISISNENHSFKQENSQLKIGLKSLFERLENAEKKLGK